jgi:hypothetical protein
MITTRLTFYILLMVFICGVGCVSPQPVRDPLAGWKPDFSHQTDQAIINDYQDYIRTLPAKKEQFVISTEYFEDGMGQHAIAIQTGENGSVWKHVLIYDNGNKRTKVIKYYNGRYQS